MKALVLLTVASLWVSGAAAAPGGKEAKTFLAFSLKAAEHRLRANAEDPDERIARLGHIRRIVGLIVDPATGDCILLGERDPGWPELRLPDFTVMLRSVFLYRDLEAPGVTVDPSQDDPDHWQVVRYFGHVEGTRVGQLCFDGDYEVLKQIGLGLRAARVPGVVSYWDAALEDAKQARAGKTEVCSRFWYYPIVARVVSVGNGVLLDECRLAVLTEVLSAKVDGQPVRDLARFYDRASERYARSFSDHFDELAQAWPAVAELRSLATLAAVSRGLARTDVRPNLDYWLHEYPVPAVETPTRVKVLRNSRAEAGLEVYGGVHLQSLSIRLKEGDLRAFSDAILQARPAPDALTWSVVVTPDSQILIPAPSGNLEANSAAEAYARGDYLFRARQYDPAIACWLQVARCYHEMGEVYYRVGLAFDRKGMPACAADYYSKGLELDPFLKNLNFRKGAASAGPDGTKTP